MAARPVAPPQRDETRIAEEAARWLEALKTADATQQAGFTTWLRQSPRHVHYFLQTTALEGVLAHADPDREFDVRELVLQSRENVVPLEAGAMNEVSGRPLSVDDHRRRTRRLAFAAAVTVVAAGIAFAVAHPWGWTEFSTSIGEQRAVELQDGSIVHLNTHSSLQVRMTERARDIRLLDGEALFIVHRDRTRPFRVTVNGSVIEAVGTQFNVYRRDRQTKVSVLEGMVRISDDRAAQPTALRAGEGAQIQSGGGIVRQAATDLIAATAWRERRLIFRSDPLRDVVAEFNRYNRSPILRLEGLDGSSRHYTGTFDAHDPEALATVLAEEKALTVERTAKEIVIRPRSSPE